LFGESSDNNSVILDCKSSSIDMRISTKRSLSYARKVNDAMNLKRAREIKLKCEEITVSDNSDSGYYSHEPKNVESDCFLKKKNNL
jgi:urocanate hydratase